MEKNEANKSNSLNTIRLYFIKCSRIYHLFLLLFFGQRLDDMTYL